MTTKNKTPKLENRSSMNDSNTELESGSWSSVREEYNRRYPWFGSQIHFTIDVIRQVVKDIRRK